MENIENDLTKAIDSLIRSVQTLLNCAYCRGTGVIKQVSTTPNFGYNINTPIYAETVCGCRQRAMTDATTAQYLLSEYQKPKAYEID